MVIKNRYGYPVDVSFLRRRLQSNSYPSSKQSSKYKMAQPDLGKDLLLIHARIFNHRAVLSGDIKQFVREFEAKRNNREVIRLQDVSSKAEKIGHVLPECCDLSSRLKTLEDQISKATDLANGILNRENNDEEIRKLYKDKRDAEWAEFTDEIEKAKHDVEKRHRERVNELKSSHQETTEQSEQSAS